MMSLAMPMPIKTMSSEKCSVMNFFMIDELKVNELGGGAQLPPRHGGVVSSAILRPIDMVVTFVYPILVSGLVVASARCLALETNTDVTCLHKGHIQFNLEEDD